MNNCSIHILPEHLIDQIKAGEVIERPSSLLKELIENAIDAKASSIDIHIKNNGLDLISIQDNGVGMNFEELPYAFVRHATSKLSRFEDLYSLYSYGFRGEALASAASISRIECISSPQQSPNSGGKITLEGSKIESHIPFENKDQGTSLIIKDLFFNTPVRLNFLKSSISEMNSLKKVFYSFLLSNPKVDFSIRFDEKEKEYYPAVEDIKQRVRDLFFKRSKKNHGAELIEFNEEYDGYHVHAYISKDASKGASGKQQFLCINKRYFQDKALHQTIVRKMASLWGVGNYGHYFVDIHVPPREIDVNVHPNKLEVKIHQSSIVNSLLSAGLSKFLTPNTLEVSLASSSTDLNAQSTSWPISSGSSISNQKERYQHFRSQDGFRSETEKYYYTKLTERFYYSYDQNKVFDLGYFLVLKLKSLLTKEIKEEHLAPLLVSEPFYHHQSLERFFKEFEKCGFHFEKVNPEMILLRTVPLEAKNFRPSQILKDFLSYTLTSRESSLKECFEQFEKNFSFKYEDLQFNQHQLSELFHLTPSDKGSFSITDELLVQWMKNE